MIEAGYPQSGVLSVERRDHIAVVWLDRPEKLNAMAHDFWADLPSIMDALSDDSSVRVVVIAARGTAFTVGIDLQAFGSELAAGAFTGDMANDVAAREEFLAMLKRMQHTFTAVAECTKPVIAAVHGYCLGGGVDLISACDIRLASSDSVFSVRETKLGMVADVGTLQRLPSIIEPGRLGELVYTDRETVAKQALVLAEEIADNSPLAVQDTKAVLRAQRRAAETQSLDHVALWNSAFFHSKDLAEAVKAFMEKRPPEFGGS